MGFLSFLVVNYFFVLDLSAAFVLFDFSACDFGDPCLFKAKSMDFILVYWSYYTLW